MADAFLADFAAAGLCGVPGWVTGPMYGVGIFAGGFERGGIFWGLQSGVGEEAFGIAAFQIKSVSGSNAERRRGGPLLRTSTPESIKSRMIPFDSSACSPRLCSGRALRAGLTQDKLKPSSGAVELWLGATNEHNEHFFDFC